MRLLQSLVVRAGALVRSPSKRGRDTADMALLDRIAGHMWTGFSLYDSLGTTKP